MQKLIIEAERAREVAAKTSDQEGRNWLLSYAAELYRQAGRTGMAQWCERYVKS